MKLYEFTQAPNPRRVRIFLAEKGVEVKSVQVDIVGGENLADEFKAINPRGVLPTLVLDDGTVIDESPAICRYFELTHPEPPLMGTDAASQAYIASVERHMEFDGIQAIGDVFRNSNPAFATRRKTGQSGDASIEGLVEQGRVGVERFFDSLNARLADSEYVAGDTFTIADITALCAVDFAKWIRMPLGDAREHANRWHASVSARPSASA